jgi:hypothetical protein
MAIKKLSPIELFIRGYHKQYRIDLEGHLNRLKREIKKWADQTEGYSHDSVKQNYRRLLNITKDVIRKGMNIIKDRVISGLRKRAKLERKIMMDSTRELLNKFLNEHRKLNNELYKELRDLIIELFKELFKEELEETPLDVDNLFPRKAATDDHTEACNTLVAAIKVALTAAGMTPCNGYNHGICFCGWGGTRQQKPVS